MGKIIYLDEYKNKKCQQMVVGEVTLTEEAIKEFNDYLQGLDVMVPVRLDSF